MVTNVLGLEAGKAYGTPGGVAVEVDGVEQSGPQPIINFLTAAIPGVTVGVVNDAGNSRNNVTVNFDGMRLLTTAGPLSGTAPGSTTLFTVPGGELLTVELVVVRCLSTSGTISGPPTAGVGFNGAADNVFSSQILTGLTAAGKIYVFPLGGVQAEIVAASVLAFGLDVGAPGGGSMSLAVDLIGRSA
jgi:hypothetical protein